MPDAPRSKGLRPHRFRKQPRPRCAPRPCRLCPEQSPRHRRPTGAMPRRRRAPGHGRSAMAARSPPSVRRLLPC
ncbi:hypothetical protein C0V78_08810 [Novosphingobium sp. TH158]|nr:hypothetical protein C0V78_08810 [Novosphingobium sp. TH158]